MRLGPLLTGGVVGALACAGCGGVWSAITELPAFLAVDWSFLGPEEQGYVVGRLIAGPCSGLCCGGAAGALIGALVGAGKGA